MKTIEAVQCIECGKLHDKLAETFIAFHGNVTVGLLGGVIGNNLDNFHHVINTTVLCPDCAVTFFTALRFKIHKGA